MSALICGSLAYDTIMVFQDQFKNHILPDKVHMLNVSFLVPRMRREFGGCAGNIAYNLKLLGDDPLPMATVGQDFGAVPRAWFAEHGIRLDCVKELAGAVHRAGVHHHRPRRQPDHRVPSRRDDAHATRTTCATSTASPSASSPRTAARRCCSTRANSPTRGIPFIFDPGQAMPLFNGEEFRAIHRARPTTSPSTTTSRSLLQERTGWDEDDDRRASVKAYIVTRGPQGSLIHTPTETSSTSRRRTSAAITDPTGCGDAYRAGLIFGMMRGYELADRAAASRR